STTVSRNHFLGSFELSGIPAGPAGKESLLVSFAYNLNGLLDVTATIQSTGKAADLSINLMEGRQEAQEGPMDVSGWQTAELADNYRSVVRRGTAFVKKLSRRADGGPLVKEMEGLLYELKRAVLIGDEDEADLLEEQILDLIELEG
ncbi:MAG: Hsp70 family protein, partial [Clostridiales bacterium]|nr:Hsp70 family protein [Clostridiales bacterium]